MFFKMQSIVPTMHLTMLIAHPNLKGGLLCQKRHLRNSGFIINAHWIVLIFYLSKCYWAIFGEIVPQFTIIGTTDL